MDTVEVLRSAARRYGLDRWELWQRRYNELLERERHAREEAGASEPTAYSYSDDARAIFPRYQVLKVIDVAIRERPLSDVRSLEEARELLAATALNADGDLCHIDGEIARGVMDEERALFAAYVREISEEELATVVPVRSLMGGPISDIGEEYSARVETLIVWEMSHAGALVSDVVLAALDTAGANYRELVPGVCVVQLASADDYERLRELLEAALVEAENEGRWLSRPAVIYVPPLRYGGGDARRVSEQASAAIFPVRSRLGGPVSDTGEEYSSRLEALIVWEMNDAGALIRDVILATLDTAGVNYSELIPGLCLLRLDSADDYEPLRELLEDASIDADEGWPSETPVIYLPPFRYVLSRGQSSTSRPKLARRPWGRIRRLRGRGDSDGAAPSS
jgi:hypothetical protein